MDRNVIWLLLLVLGWTGGLEANANDQQHVVPMEKVLPDQSQLQQQQQQKQQQLQLQKYLPADEQRTEHDKSAVKMQKKILQTLPSESHQHQHHLRHRLGQLEKHQLAAWELQDGFLLQRHHQHKSQSQPSHIESRPTDSTNVIRHATPTATTATTTTIADDIDYSYNNRELGAVQTETATATETPIVNRKLVTNPNTGNRNSYPKKEEANKIIFTASQWEKREEKHPASANSGGTSNIASRFKFGASKQRSCNWSGVEWGPSGKQSLGCLQLKEEEEG
ncbi:hypothetical protein ACLKA6_005437 [Drosophila palustris]